MTAHDHRERVEGCYRCDLSRDELLLAAAHEAAHPEQTPPDWTGENR